MARIVSVTTPVVHLDTVPVASAVGSWLVSETAFPTWPHIEFDLRVPCIHVSVDETSL